MKLFFFLSFQTGNKIKSDLEKEGLKGKIKEITQEAFEVKGKPGKIIKSWKYDNFWENYKMKYDSTGNLVEWLQYKLDGSINTKIIYKYNAQEVLTERDKYYGDGKLETREPQTYDAKGSLIEITSFLSNDIVERKETYKSMKERIHAIKNYLAAFPSRKNSEHFIEFGRAIN